MNLDAISWQEKLDELERVQDAAHMALFMSVRADMELFAAAALRFSQVQGLALKQRGLILDALAVHKEHHIED